ncbi:hypothetical protein [Frigoribacterium sp. RIT-PI-h]|uniref:hypothetical protein n=1 Tax=Frigoribacterium sp. RIT-PI-h TaxID=1690245 RepID=UPI0006B98D02|nr:hypothetical protein AEQ27_02220 [Frigoribacterium sp. RIT-PI-h]
MIDARNLTKIYGDKRALDAPTFTVRPGLVTGCLGPHGARQPTTLRLHARPARPTPRHPRAR